MSTFLLHSERLSLRDFSTSDWQDVQACASHPQVHRFSPWGPITAEQARGYVAQVIEQAQQHPRLNYNFVIIETRTETTIGACGLTGINQQFRRGEILYHLHPDYWGRGYATEIARKLLELAFSTCGLHRVIAACDPRNTASLRVIEKLGMQYEGRLRETALLREGWRDSLLYSMLEHEWLATA